MKLFHDRIRRSLAITLAAVLSAGFIYFLYIKITGHGLPCFFNELTHMYCPTCGASRMFMALTRLDFRAAFEYNALVPALAFVWGAVWVCAFAGKPAAFRNADFIMVLLYISLAATVAFTVIRNLVCFFNGGYYVLG